MLPRPVCLFPQLESSCLMQFILISLTPSRIVAADLKFMRKNLCYNRTNYKTNTEVLNEIKIASVIEKTNVHKSNWRNHVNRTPRNTLSRTITNFITKGSRNPGRPIKRLMDSWKMAGTGQKRPISMNAKRWWLLLSFMFVKLLSHYLYVAWFYIFQLTKLHFKRIILASSGIWTLDFSFLEQVY